jgi:glycosyltransferase involved in cell wall biosynthesis
MPFGDRAGEYLTVVGRASPDKGIAEAIELARAAGVPLRIAAKAIDPAEREYLSTYIAPALGDGIEFLGELAPKDRDPLMAGALATLMLGAWPEPFGLVAIESLATGTPVIARRAGALPEIIEHGVDGFLVDDLREARLAVRLVADLDRKQIRDRAIARFDIERMVTAYERLYRTLITGAERAGGPGHDGHDAKGPGIEETRPLVRVQTVR